MLVVESNIFTQYNLFFFSYLYILNNELSIVKSNVFSNNSATKKKKKLI